MNFGGLKGIDREEKVKIILEGIHREAKVKMIRKMKHGKETHRVRGNMTIKEGDKKIQLVHFSETFLIIVTMSTLNCAIGK